MSHQLLLHVFIDTRGGAGIAYRRGVCVARAGRPATRAAVALAAHGESEVRSPPRGGAR